MPAVPAVPGVPGVLTGSVIGAEDFVSRVAVAVLGVGVVCCAPAVAGAFGAAGSFGIDNSRAISAAVSLTGLGTGYIAGISPNPAYVKMFPVASCNSIKRPNRAL